MQGHRFLGIAMVLAGAMLMWMVVAAATVTQVQLDDPLVGHLARNSIWYVAAATVVGLLGSVVFFPLAPGNRRRRRAVAHHAMAHRLRSADDVHRKSKLAVLRWTTTAAAWAGGCLRKRLRLR